MYNQTRTNIIDRLKTAFDYLQIEVGRGPHGLIRLLNSDWNDDVHFVYNPAPYNRVWESGESLVNTGMALVMLQNLSEQLKIVAGKDKFEKEKGSINWLIESFSKYREELLSAYQKELESRNFLRRAYFTGDQLLGENEVYLLPQAFALQVAEVSVEKKKEIHNQVSVRLSEKLGFRNREFSTRNHFALPGMGENGGFWWVPNSQYIIGVSQFDKETARQLYKKQLLSNHARQFPDKWLGYWSASDFVVSSKNIREGQSAGLPFSALPHAFNLYLWYKLYSDVK
jgi:cellobiose phosphorylase